MAFPGGPSIDAAGAADARCRPVATASSRHARHLPGLLRRRLIFHKWRPTANAALLTSASIIGLCIVLLTSAFAFWFVVTRSQEKSAETSADLAALTGMLLDVVDAEAGQRGYLLTGDPAYLETYRLALPKVSLDLSTLESIKQSHPAKSEDVDALSDVLDRKMAELAETVSSYQADMTRAALAVVRTNQGLRLMGDLRAAEARLAAALQDEAARALADAKTTSRYLLWLAVGTVAAAVFFMGFSARLLIVGERVRRASLHALEESERRFRQVVESIADHAIFTLDRAGYVTSWNPGSVRINGYAENEIVGHHVSTFFTEDDRVAGLPEQMLQTATDSGRCATEGWRLRKSGERFWSSGVLEPIYDDVGAAAGFVAVNSRRHRATRCIRGRAGRPSAGSGGQPR